MNKSLQILLVYFLITNVAIGQSDNIFSKENTLKYAQFLIENQNFKAAASEYNRLLQNEPYNDTLRYQTIILFRLANQIDSCFYYINTYERKHPDFEKEYITLLILSEQWKELETFVSTCTLSNNEKQMAKLHQFMWSGKWKKAQKQLENVSMDNMDRIFAYNKLIEEGINTPNRSIGMAVTLSALLPGLGKVYAGAPLEGLSTFVISGFLAFSAYRGFSQDQENSVPGWIFASGFVGFYAGNIYGTVKQVKKFNAKYKTKLRDAVQSLAFTNF